MSLIILTKEEAICCTRQLKKMGMAGGADHVSDGIKEEYWVTLTI